MEAVHHKTTMGWCSNVAVTGHCHRMIWGNKFLQQFPDLVTIFPWELESLNMRLSQIPPAK